MPVPASEAIASDVGHGALGVRSALRPFRDLLSETVGQRHLWVELRPKKVLATWEAVDDPATYYSKPVAETFDGVTLDVVGVRTLTETLARVESEARCDSGAGTFYYSGSSLYIHLTGDANPSGTTVVAELGIHIGSHGVHQPVLLPDRLANGSLEAWTGTTPDGWTTATDANCARDKTTDDPLQGSYAARFTFTNCAAGGGILYQAFSDLVPGQAYRVSAAYRINSPTDRLYAILYVYDGSSNYMQSDGRNSGGAAQAVIDAQSAGAAWKRFTYDFVAPSWTPVRIYLRAQIVSGTQTGTVDFDDVKLQPISRYAYHEPLLSIDSVPTIEAARADSFWGQMSSALGSLSLINGNGYLEPLLAAYDWLGAQAVFRVGGRFQLAGNETAIDDCPVIASGKLGTPRVSDTGVTFDLEDDRSILKRTLPRQTYNNNGRDAYVQEDRGRSRPMLFGTKLGVRPVQYGIHYTGGGPIPLGDYEYIDVTGTPGAWFLPGEDFSLRWYLDEQAASRRNAELRTNMPGGSDLQSDSYSIDPDAGTLRVLLDCRPLVITEENNKIAFHVGGATFVAQVALGTYHLQDDQVFFEGSTEEGLLKAIRVAMNAAASTADIDADFVASTQKVQITKGAGTLSLLCQTGLDSQTGIWALLGFDASADKTGSLTYTAENVFTLQPEHHTLRFDTYGYRDDASGTYTGSANALITKAPDIAHFLLRVFLGVPASAIDTASFVAARAGADRACSLYIGSPRTVADIFEELETSGDMDLVLKGGVWYCYTRDTTVPAGTPDLVDADFLSFEAGYEPEDLYGTVVLSYNESPDGGDPIPVGGWYIGYQPHARTEMGETTDATVELRHGRPETRAFRTCLSAAADAAYPLAGSRLEEVAEQAQTKRRRFRFATKGKALQVPVGGKIRLTRTRGLDTTGALSNVLVRALRKRDDWARWVSEVEAIEVI